MEAFFPDTHFDGPGKHTARSLVLKIQNVNREANTCRLLREGTWPFHEPYKTSLWERDRLRLLIRELDHTNCLPLLLAAVCLEERKFAEIVHLVEVFAFRYKMICNLHVTPLTALYHKHSQQIRQDPKEYRSAFLREDFRELIKHKATDSLFAASIPERLCYQPAAGNQLTRYFLATVEHYLHWYERGSVGRAKVNDVSRVFDPSTTSIEHIYPLKPAPADRDAKLEKLVNTLGNLTLLCQGDNDSVANQVFSAKRPYFKKSSLRINQLIGNVGTWNREAVKKREGFLVDAALKVFAI